jgi:hypothetical protein
LGQCDRLFGGVNYGFQLCFKAHSTIGTSSMVPDVERPCRVLGDLAPFMSGKRRPRRGGRL